MERAGDPAELVGIAEARLGVPALGDIAEAEGSLVLRAVRQQQAVEVRLAVLDVEIEPGVGDVDVPGAVDRPVEPEIDALGVDSAEVGVGDRAEDRRAVEVVAEDEEVVAERRP